jgi:hypothetical protein
MVTRPPPSIFVVLSQTAKYLLEAETAMAVIFSVPSYPGRKYWFFSSVE